MAKSILLWTTPGPAKRATPKLEFVRVFRLNRWLTYLIVVPIIAAVTLLAIFFFAVLLGLSAAVLVVVGLRVWWLRWKLDHSRSPEIFEDRYGVINDACIVEKEIDKGDSHSQGARERCLDSMPDCNDGWLIGAPPSDPR